MEIEFLEKFSKDLDAIKDNKIKLALKQLIINLETIKTLAEISKLKKLKGHKTAYRIRLGDYRVGFYFENNIIELARFIHRKDIYKYFP